MSHRATVQVLLFAAAAEAAGADSVSIELDFPIAVSALNDSLATAYPQLGRILTGSRLAVDQRFVPAEFVIETPPREIAVIPPVSGG